MPDWEALGRAVASSPVGKQVAHYVTEDVIPTVKEGIQDIADSWVSNTEKTGRTSRPMQAVLMRHAASPHNHAHLADVQAQKIFAGLTPEQVIDYGLVNTTRRWSAHKTVQKAKIAAAQARIAINTPIAASATHAADRHAANKAIKADRDVIADATHKHDHSTIPHHDKATYDRVTHEPWFAEVDRKHKEFYNWAQQVNHAVGQKATLKVPGHFSHLWHVDEEGSIPRSHAMYHDSARGVNIPLDVDEDLARAGIGRGATPTRTERAGRRSTGETGGMAHGYEVDPIAGIRRWYAHKWPTFAHREVYRLGQDLGWMVPVEPGARIPKTHIFNGVEHEVGIKDPAAPLIENPDHAAEDDFSRQAQPATVRTLMMPKHMKREIEAVDRGREPMTPGQKLANMLERPIVHAGLLSPGMPVMHGKRLTQSIAGNPVTTSAKEHAQNAITSAIYPIGTANNASDEFWSPRGQKLYPLLLEHGGTRPNSYEAFEVKAPGKGTIGEKIRAPEQSMFGNPLSPPDFVHPQIRRYWGMESQIRTAAAMRFEDMYTKLHGHPPHIAETVRFVNRLGNYNSGTHSEWIRFFRQHGFPFLAHQARQFGLEAGQAVGLGHGVPIPEGKGAGVTRAKMAIRTLLAMGATPILTRALLDYAANGGHRPDDVDPMDIYYPPEKSITGKPVVVSFHSLFPAYARGIDIAGIHAAIKAKNEKGGLGENFGRNWMHDLGNVGLEMPGPGWKDIAEIMLNRRLHLTPKLDFQKFEHGDESAEDRARDVAIQGNPLTAALSGSLDPGEHGNYGSKAPTNAGDVALRALGLLGGPRGYDYTPSRGRSSARGSPRLPRLKR